MSQSLKYKVPPHNLEAETATLGALLLDWEAVGDVIKYLRPDRFYSLQNQKIFAAIIELSNKSQRADLITLIEQLKKSGTLEEAGGLAYVSSLTDTVPTSANVEYYAKIVLDQAIRRDLLKLSASLVEFSHDDTISSRASLEEAQKEIFNLTDLTTTHTIKRTGEIVNNAIDMITKLYNNKNDITGVPSGFYDLDKRTSGFQNSELIIIGARPSIGKTAIALSMAQNIAIDHNIATAFFSLEMSDTQIVFRLLTQESRVNAEYLRTGKLRQEDLQKIFDAAGKIYDAPLYIVDSPNMKLLDLRTLARRLKSQHDVKIIFIDYITLITSENTSIPRHEQIAEISRSLKSLARELEIPIVVLSQVKRDSEGKQPSLADLRESGSIEQDADVVMFLHRERASASSEDQKFLPIDTQLILAKQRNGPTGIIDLQFFPNYTRFENKAEHS